jgi:hypothetical protein
MARFSHPCHLSLHPCHRLRHVLCPRKRNREHLLSCRLELQKNENIDPTQDRNAYPTQNRPERHAWVLAQTLTGFKLLGPTGRNALPISLFETELTGRGRQDPRSQPALP